MTPRPKGSLRNWRKNWGLIPWTPGRSPTLACSNRWPCSGFTWRSSRATGLGAPTNSSTEETRRAFRLLDGCRHQRLQFPVEHGGGRADALVAKLAEQRGRLIVLHAGLPFLILVDQHTHR